MNLFDAVEGRNIEGLKQLLADQNVDPNICEDYTKITPLHLAAQNGFLDVFKILVAAGANIETKTKDGDTPLDIAVLHKHNEIIDFMRDVQSR